MNDQPLNVQPGTGTWVVDSAASTIGFRAKALFGMKVTGRFERYESSINVGADGPSSTVSVTVRADSVATGSKKRDEHLRSSNVFAVTEFPTIEFTSTAVTQTADGIDLAGNLRVRDITKPVTLHATRSGDANHYTAEVIVMPKEFGITRPGTGKPLTIVVDAVLRPL